MEMILATDQNETMPIYRATEREKENERKI